jgi:hypothetical protein
MTVNKKLNDSNELSSILAITANWNAKKNIK